MAARSILLSTAVVGAALLTLAGCSSTPSYSGSGGGFNVTLSKVADEQVDSNFTNAYGFSGKACVYHVVAKNTSAADVTVYSEHFTSNPTQTQPTINSLVNGSKYTGIYDSPAFKGNGNTVTVHPGASVEFDTTAICDDKSHPLSSWSLLSGPNSAPAVTVSLGG